MKLFKDKRGNWSDIFEYIGTGIGVGIVVVLVSLLLVNFFSHINTISQGTDIIKNESLDLARSASVDFPNGFDFIVPILYIVFLGFSLWSARRIPSSHLLSWLAIILFVILGLLSLVAESIWDKFINNDTTVIVKSTLTFTHFFLDNLRFFVLLYSVLVGWALYAKDE